MDQPTQELHLCRPIRGRRLKRRADVLPALGFGLPALPDRVEGRSRRDRLIGLWAPVGTGLLADPNLRREPEPQPDAQLPRRLGLHEGQ
jgi:hypothetical protein